MLMIDYRLKKLGEFGKASKLFTSTETQPEPPVNSLWQSYNATEQYVLVFRCFYYYMFQ